MTTVTASELSKAVEGAGGGCRRRLGARPVSTRFTLDQRSAGVLLHVTSLPGGHGLGDLGPAATAFIDFLAAAGQRWWQVLPVGPAGPGNAPYNAVSAFAGSPLLISLERLCEDGLLDAADIVPTPELADGPVDFERAAAFKGPRLRRAYRRFVAGGGMRDPAFRAFCRRHDNWLADYALYAALKRRYCGRPWTRWPVGIRDRHRMALAATRFRPQGVNGTHRASGGPHGLALACGVRIGTLSDDIDFERFVQFQFERQWTALRRYAHDRGVGLIGDVPIFVAHDSADVWAHPDLFDLDERGRPRTVSGVPPDYFSRTGQRWGHPQYRWRRHRATRFAWWGQRLVRARQQFDAVRLDHFLGFHRVWAVPGSARTARRGRWVRTPGSELLATIRRRLGRMEVIAEDLGAAEPAALALRDRFGFPGMRVLQFGLADEGGNHHQPHNFPRCCVAYTGTHDNDTVAGWYAQLRRKSERGGDGLAAWRRVLLYTGTSGRQIHWDLIRLAWLSPADVAIAPVQDLLGLDSTARMNTPGTSHGNWAWRLHGGELDGRLARRLRALTRAAGRLVV